MKILEQLEKIMLWWWSLRLKSKDSSTRRRAVEKLGALKNPHVTELLIESLKDKDKYVRLWAAVGLGKIGDGRGSEPLVTALRDQYERVRLMAAEALGKIRDAVTVEALVLALKDEYPDVRRAAAEALGEIGDTRAVDHLVAALKNKDMQARQRQPKMNAGPFKYQDIYAREAAVRAVGKINGAEAVMILIDLAIGDEELAEKSISVLQSVFEHDARSIKSDDLSAVVLIDNVYQKLTRLEWRSEENPYAGASFDNVTIAPDYISSLELVQERIAVDCSQLRRLASQELTRRVSLISMPGQQ